MASGAGALAPVPDHSFELSAELSRIIDENIAVEERAAEFESELVVRYREELARAEADHLQRLRAELSMQQEQAEQIVEIRRNQDLAAATAAQVRAALQASERDATLREELEQYAVTLRQESNARTEEQQTQMTAEIA